MKRLAAAAAPAVCALLGIGSLIAPASPLSAQVAPSTGDTIRVSTGPGQVQRGTLAGLDGDRLVLMEADGTRSEIARSDLAQIDILVGKERQFVRRMALTMGALAVGAGVINAAKWSACTDPCGTGSGDQSKLDLGELQFRPFGADSRMEAFRVGAKFGGLLIGIPMGVLIGSIKRELWQEGNLSPASGTSTSIDLAESADGGLGISVSVPVGAVLR